MFSREALQFCQLRLSKKCVERRNCSARAPPVLKYCWPVGLCRRAFIICRMYRRHREDRFRRKGRSVVCLWSRRARNSLLTDGYGERSCVKKTEMADRHYFNWALIDFFKSLGKEGEGKAGSSLSVQYAWKKMWINIVRMAQMQGFHLSMHQ